MKSNDNKNNIRESENCTNCKYGVNEKHKYYSIARRMDMEGEYYCSKKNCHVGRFLSCALWERK